MMVVVFYDPIYSGPKTDSVACLYEDFEKTSKIDYNYFY